MASIMAVICMNKDSDLAILSYIAQIKDAAIQYNLDFK